MEGLDIQSIIRKTIDEYGRRDAEPLVRRVEALEKLAGEVASLRVLDADAFAYRVERDSLQRLLTTERALTVELKGRLADLARRASQTERGL